MTSWSSKIIAVGHRREQPAHGRLAPRVAVRGGSTPRSRRSAGRAATSTSRRRADELLGGRRDLVGVDLVAEHEQQVRPLVGLLRRACAAPARAGRRARGPRGPRPWSASTAARWDRRTRHEPNADPQAVVVGDRAHAARAASRSRAAARRARRRARPRTGVALRRQPGDVHEREVMALDLERAARGAAGPRPRTARRPRPTRSRGPRRRGAAADRRPAPEPAAR